MMRRLAAILAAAPLLALAAVAQAQEGPTTGFVVVVDSNKDGAVDRPEFDTFMEVTFVNLDLSKDGNLEWSEAKEILDVTAFKAADADGNNAISRAEYSDQVAKDFAAADRDGDGVLK